MRVDQRLAEAVTIIRRHYGRRLLATALFGSRAKDRSRADSDWDVLLIVDDGVPIRRSLYREWDERMAPAVETVLSGIAPHFTLLPGAEASPSSLWLEVATAHVILSDPTERLAAWLQRVRSFIDEGRFERRAAHGLPYWRSSP